jgi:hypothetical protein
MFPRTFPQANLGKNDGYQGGAPAFVPLCCVLPQPLYSISPSHVKMRKRGCFRLRVQRPWSWVGNYVGSKSGHIQSVKALQYIVSNTPQHRQYQSKGKVAALYTVQCTCQETCAPAQERRYALQKRELETTTEKRELESPL